MRRLSANKFLFDFFTRIKRIDEPNAPEIKSFDEITDDLDNKLKRIIAVAINTRNEEVISDDVKILYDILNDYSDYDLIFMFISVLFLVRTKKYYSYIGGLVFVRSVLEHKK